MKLTYISYLPLAGNKLIKPKVVLKEWVASRTGSAPRCDEVVAEPLDWLVPGLHRLWMGTMVEDKNRRLRAFLSCMNCDVPQNLLLNTSYVPQHLLILCCVLRYELPPWPWGKQNYLLLNSVTTVKVTRAQIGHMPASPRHVKVVSGMCIYSITRPIKDFWVSI